MSLTWQKQSIQNILPHIIGWLVIGIFPLILFEQQNERSHEWIIRFYHQLLFMALAFYVNYLVLVPYLLFRDKKTKYFLAAFLLSIVIILLSHYTRQLISQYSESLRGAFEFPKEIHPKRNIGRMVFWRSPLFFNAYWGTLLVIGFSTGIRITQHWSKTKYKQKELEKAHVDSELAFLKNQVSPHFFFNTLNNIYALIKIDDDKAQQAVERLSNMMRYLIYESEGKHITLEKEVEFMKHYIDLMTLRISKKVELKVDFPEEIPDVQVPPLLFISFIENAFKHGISYRAASFIHITMTIEEPFITFSSQNSKHDALKNDEQIDSGIGLANIRKRLQLLYGSDVNLNIHENNTTFDVQLKVPYESSLR